MRNEASTRAVGVVDGILLASWTAGYAFLLFGFQVLKWFERVFAQRKRNEPTAGGGRLARGEP